MYIYTSASLCMCHPHTKTLKQRSHANTKKSIHRRRWRT